MAAPLIGDGVARCPVCGGKARLSLSSSGLAVMTLNCCKGQIFARGDDCDTRLRALKVDAEPVTAPPAADPVPDTPPPPPRRGGLLHWLTED